MKNSPHALGIAARAKGMSLIAQEACCACEQLYRSLSKKGNPTLKTILAILGALAAPENDAYAASNIISSGAKRVTPKASSGARALAE